MDEEKLNKFTDGVWNIFYGCCDAPSYKRTVTPEIVEIVQKIFQYGYEAGSQETSNELGKQVEEQLKQAFRRYGSCNTNQILMRVTDWKQKEF